MAFLRKTDIKSVEFGIVLEAINRFLYKPLSAAVEDRGFTEKWCADVSVRG